jgi:RNA polymerase sigma factor for flagellar operon FliA
MVFSCPAASKAMRLATRLDRYSRSWIHVETRVWFLHVGASPAVAKIRRPRLGTHTGISSAGYLATAVTVSVEAFVHGVQNLEARDTLNDGNSMSVAERRTAERKLKGLRDRLVVDYSPLVRYVAGGISARMTGPLDREDVLSWGVLGLLDAIETYDPERRTKFESYAISKIRWSILDEMRSADPLTRRVRRRVREVDLTKGELAQRLGRMPTEEEVARERGVGIAEHRAFLERCSRAHVGSLEARLESEGSLGAELHQMVADSRAADPESAAEAAELRAQLLEAIKTLGEQERVVTTFYFYEGLTLREIGGVLDLTEGRISQILHRALAKLRKTLSQYPQPSARW